MRAIAGAKHNADYRARARRITGGMNWAGIELDPEANKTCVGSEASIARPHSRAAVLVVPVDEASIIATEAVALLAN